MWSRPPRKAGSKKVDRSISHFLDRVIDADGATLIRTYETRIRSLEEEKALLEEEAPTAGVR